MPKRTERMEARFPPEMREQGKIKLANDRFDHFIKVYEAAKAPSKKVLKAARQLDGEGL